MSYTPGRFVWFEHSSNDIAKARAFYEKLFDWNTEMMAIPGSDPYPVIHNGDNGISAATPRRLPEHRHAAGSRTCRSATSTPRAKRRSVPARKA